MQTLELTPLAEAGTPEWHELRLTGIGGSEAAAAAGVSEWKTAREVYEGKVGNLPPIEQTARMRLGSALEPVIIGEFQRQTSLTVADASPGLLRHPEHEWMLGTPDGVLEGAAIPAVVECKATNWRMAKRLGEDGSADIPPDWTCQVTQYMGILGLAVAHIAVLVDGYTLRTFRVERNEKLLDGLITAEGELWERIVNRDPPEPDFEHAKTPELIRAMYGNVSDTSVIDLSRESADAWGEYERIGHQVKELERERATAKARVLAEIGEHFAGVLPDGTHMIRRQKRPETDVAYTRKAWVDVRKCKVPKGR